MAGSFLQKIYCRSLRYLLCSLRVRLEDRADFLPVESPDLSEPGERKSRVSPQERPQAETQSQKQYVQAV